MKYIIMLVLLTGCATTEAPRQYYPAPYYYGPYPYYYRPYYRPYGPYYRHRASTSIVITVPKVVVKCCKVKIPKP